MLFSKLEGQLFSFVCFCCFVVVVLHTTISVDTFPDVMRNTQKIANYFFGKVFYMGPDIPGECPLQSDYFMVFS